MTVGPLRRPAAVLVAVLAAALAMTSAAGFDRVAAAAGLTSTGASSAPGAAGPGFLPAPNPVRVTAPSLRITGLSAIEPNSPVPVVGGGTSPADTILLRFDQIELDDLRIAVSAAAPFRLVIANDGRGTSAARIGGPGETTNLWGVIHRLDLCLNAATLSGLATALPVVGPLIGQLIASSSQDGGPCFPLESLLPILGKLLDAGIPLPSPIPANNLDIDVWALHVTDAAGRTSLDLPRTRLSVTER